MHGDCPEAMAADLIVNGLPLGRLSVYLAERTRLPDIAVLLGLAGVEQEQLPRLGDGVRVIPRNLTGPALVEAVR